MHSKHHLLFLIPTTVQMRVKFANRLFLIAVLIILSQLYVTELQVQPTQYFYFICIASGVVNSMRNLI